MKKMNIAAALPALFFIGLLAAMSIANIILPQKISSDMENRKLALFVAPTVQTIQTGAWMEGIETYASDQFLLRDGFMRVKTVTDLALQRKDNGRVYFGRDGYLFSVDSIDEAREKNSLKITSDFLLKVRRQQPKLHLSVLLAPTAKSILGDYLPSYAPVSDESEAIGLARDFFAAAADPDLTFTDPSEALLKAADQAQLYYRTDHHWTTDGSYIAYQQWALDNGFTPVSPRELIRETVTDSFLGTHQSKAPGVSATPDEIQRYLPKQNQVPPGDPYRVTVWKDITKPEAVEQRDSLYDDSFLETKDKYAYFLGGNDPQVRIQTNVKNDRRLLLIKDSYANCMVPFLALHYEEIYITDLRYSHGRVIWPEDEKAQASTSITDILFLYNIESFSSDRNLAYLLQLNLPAAH